MLIEPLGYNPKLSHTFYSLLTGYFANFAIPRIGEITRCASLSKAEKIPFDKLIGTVITERIMDVLMLLVTILIAAIVEFDLIGNFLYEKLFQPLIEKISSSGSLTFYLIAGLIIILLIVMIRYFFKSEKFKIISGKVKKLISGIGDGIKTIRNLKSFGWFAFHTVFMWILYFFCSYVCFFALDATSHLGVKEGLLVLVLGGIGMSAPVQGGIGAYHWLVSQGLMLFAISESDGKTFATMVHTYQVLVIVVLGLFSFIMLFLANKKQPLSENKP